MPVSVNYIRKTLKIRTCKETLRKCMVKNNLKWSKCPLTIPYSKINLDKRFKFAELHLSDVFMWEKVLFSDEKCFSLLGSVSKLKCWSENYNKHYLTYDRHQGGHVSVWGAIWYNFKTPLVIIKGYLRSEQYIKILNDTLLPYIDEFEVFQQDNAPPHVSKQTKQWMEENNINILSWPPRSPDFNIIENCWGWLSNQVYANGQQYHSKDELISAIKDKWNNMDHDVIKNLYKSIPKRLVECLKVHGRLTKY